jgi:DNA ligase D-like protein (predicted ligase)
VIKTIKPMLAQTASEPFDHKDWLFELKLDGVRCIACLDRETRLQARSGQDITAQFPELQQLHCQVSKPCILDGEIICASFSQVQRRIHKEKPLDIRIAQKEYPSFYFVFDILYLDGNSLMAKPIIDRKLTLNSVFVSDYRGRLLGWQTGYGISLFNEVRKKGLEGIMAKYIYSPYLEGKRSDSWLKIKNFQEGSFYVCGLTEGENDRNTTFGSLILGERVGDKFVHVGNVGSGFDQQQLTTLLAFFRTLQGECPFEQASIGRPVKFWTKPIVKCEVRYFERGKDGKLRFPTFRRLEKKTQE